MLQANKEQTAENKGQVARQHALLTLFFVLCSFVSRGASACFAKCSDQTWRDYEDHVQIIGLSRDFEAWTFCPPEV